MSEKEFEYIGGTMFGSGACCDKVWEGLRRDERSFYRWFPPCSFLFLVLMAVLFGLPSPVRNLPVSVFLVAFGAIYYFWTRSELRPHKAYIVATVDGEVHAVPLAPHNDGPQAAMFRPVVNLPSGLTTTQLVPIWLEIEMMKGYHQPKLCASIEFAHCLQGWRVETTDPSRSLSFTDWNGWRRVVTGANGHNLVMIFNMIKGRQSFADLEAERLQTLDQREQVVRSLCRRLMALEAYLQSTKGEVRGQPMDELRRVVASLMPGSQHDGGADMFKYRLDQDFDPSVLLEDLRHTVDLKYGFKAAPAEPPTPAGSTPN